MRVLMNMRGTAYRSAPGSHRHISLLPLRAVPREAGRRVYILRMSVRTDDTRLINRALTLPSSRPPKPGSDADAVQPTIRPMSAYDSGRRVLYVGIEGMRKECEVDREVRGSRAMR